MCLGSEVLKGPIQIPQLPPQTSRHLREHLEGYLHGSLTRICPVTGHSVHILCTASKYMFKQKQFSLKFMNQTHQYSYKGIYEDVLILEMRHKCVMYSLCPV